MALAWGRGERMIGLPALPAREVIALVPSFGVSTADAYRWVDETRHAAGGQAWRKSGPQLADWDAIDRMAENDFDEPVFARHPALRALVDGLRAAGAGLAMLSGSGSTVIGAFPGMPNVMEAPGDGVRLVRTRTAAAVAPIRLG
jgi:4-diphosphocytidyl-2-C-methyl-D-erythritol kinase